MKTTFEENLPQKLERLIRTAGIGEIDFKHKFAAVKIHFGEPGNLAFLRPNYAAVVVDVVGQGKPWFCAYVCPSGTFLGGIPMVAANAGLRTALGWLWRWKLALLIGIVILSLFYYRPFCRYLCPLGAIYGCFNPVSILRYRLDKDACIQCGKCQKACPFAIDPSQTPNHVECIRCGRCLDACPTDALTGILSKRKP